MGVYVRLVDYNSQQAKEDAFLSGSDRYVADSSNFSEIPGAPIAYWVSDNFFRAFQGNLLSNTYETKKGMFTGDNGYFLRLWFEVAANQIGANYLFYNKGGGYQRWYGNDETVVKWHNNGSEIKAFKGSGNINESYFFKGCLTWNLVSTAPFCCRIIGDDHVMGDAGPICLAYDQNAYYALAYMNTRACNFFMSVLNPTMNYPSGVVSKLPYSVDNSFLAKVIALAKQSVEFAQTDWDSFETSWDFKKHPLI